MHTFTDFSDGALFGPEVRFFLVETLAIGLHVLLFFQDRACVDIMHLSSVGTALPLWLGEAELASGEDQISLGG